MVGNHILANWQVPSKRYTAAAWAGRAWESLEAALGKHSPAGPATGLSKVMGLPPTDCKRTPKLHPGEVMVCRGSVVGVTTGVCPIYKVNA